MAEWPKLSTGYQFSSERLKTVDRALPADCCPSERTLSAAVALCQAAHAGDGQFAIHTARGCVDGAVEGTIRELLERVSSPAKQTGRQPAQLRVVYERDDQPSQAPVSVTFRAQRGLGLDYDSQVLLALEAEWFLGHVARAIERLAYVAPDEEVRNMDLIDEHEAVLIERYSHSPPPSEAYPSECKTLHSFFQHAARQYPDSVALQFDDRTFTFKKLLRIATEAAGQLIEHGVKPGQVVPLCVDKSVEMIVGMLAILLSGAAYLNLEPKFPSTRKQGIVEELQASGLLAGIALVQPEEVESWSSWTSDSNPLVQPVDLMTLVKPCISAAFHQERPIALPEVDPSSPCYIIYTSGSTGKPKGIIVEHRNVAAFLRNYRGVFGRAHGERVLQFPSYAFDVSVMNIWDTFAHGATLCMTESATLMSGLADAILRLDCTLVDLTPTISALLFDHPEAEPKEGESIKDAWQGAGFRIKVVNTGGEKVESWVRDAWNERGVRVVIDYGPSETTVGVIANQRTDADLPLLPIGRPTGNNIIHILSPFLEPVPLGCVGEICVAGEQVTRGYVRTELNAKVFVDHPRFGRIYKTGDLGRFLGDGEGSIDCLGRIDGQVKVNGLRIEIGEIEKHLTPALHPSISRGVVDRIETDQIPVGLVAFILPTSGSDIAKSSTVKNSDETSILSAHSGPAFSELVEAAKAGLAKVLPQYMVPRYWLPVNKIPTQGMGKTDRKTLRALAESHSFRQSTNAQKDIQQTRDEWHDAMRRAWAKILRAEASTIADDDEFTKLGGDSIGFTRMIGLLRKDRYSVSFGQLATARTLSDCAGVLQQSRRRDDTNKPVAPFSLLKDKSKTLEELCDDLSLSLDDIEDVLPTAPPQDALLAGSFDSTHYYAQAVYPVDEQVSFQTLQQALQRLVERHAAMRTCFALPSAEEQAVQIVLKPHNETVRRCTEVQHLGDVDDLQSRIDRFLEQDRELHHFEWGRLALSFAYVENRQAKKLIWGMHHAVSDGWTLEVLTSDLRDLCFGHPLPERPSYATFVQSWTAAEGEDQARNDFWQRYLDGAQSLSWPAQSENSEASLATTEEVVMSWTGDLSRLARTNGITPAIASRVAIGIALGRAAGWDDVTLGIVRSGRDVDVLQAEEMVGCCVSVLPSRLRLDSTLSLLDLAHAETRADRDARVHQKVTLSQLAKLGSFQDRSAMFNILVTYQSLAERDEEEERRAPWPIRQPPSQIRMPTSYALSFEITPSRKDKDALELACFYDKAVIDRGSVEGVVQSIARVLDYITTAPCTKLAELKLDQPVPRPAETKASAVATKNGHANGADIEPFVAQLKSLWSTILRIPEDEIDERATFASLGGDSISAMRLSSRLSKAGLKIPIAKLTKLPTIIDQANYLATAK